MAATARSRCSPPLSGREGGTPVRGSAMLPLSGTRARSIALHTSGWGQLAGHQGIDRRRCHPVQARGVCWHPDRVHCLPAWTCRCAAFSATHSSEANWKSPSVPAEIDTMRSSRLLRQRWHSEQVGAGRSHRASLELHDHGGAISAAVWIWASRDQGRRVSYQMVPTGRAAAAARSAAIPWAAA